MRVTKDGEFYRGSHITGPTHNFLRMRVHLGQAGGPVVRVLQANGGCSHGAALEAEEVLEWIGMGVDRANNELEATYGALEAEVVANDSRRPEVYAELARRIILMAHDEKCG